MDFQKICWNCMKEKTESGGFCPYCGFNNDQYECPSHHLRPLTPLNGKYLIGRSIGEGGFGITYIALDMHLNIVVAIKELYIKQICNRDNRDDGRTVIVNSQNEKRFDENKNRFLEEARVLAMFNEQDNEGVVTVKDHFEENNTAYIVMEYLKGRTLKEIIKQGRLSFDQAKDFFTPIFHALNKIHQFGVIHLDVSPDNIMLLDDGRAKLLDFGGAKNIGEKVPESMISFKRGYAPPEQYMKNGRLGRWTDVYAAGATVYYCLTGKKPTESMERRAGAELPRPSALGVKIPASSEDALMKAMELDPDRRYQTVEEFWSDFNNRKTKKKTGKGGNLRQKKKTGIIIAVAVAAVAAAVVLLLLHKDNPNSASSSNNSTETELINNGTEAESTVQEETTESSGDVTYTVGEPIPMTLGTYIFENAADRNYILGIDGGFGDDGAALTLQEYEDANKNRFSITDEDENDGFYNLRASHTNSFIETSESNDIGETVRQFSTLYDAGTEKWIFIYCGHDDEKDMEEVIIQNAAGSVLAPKDGNVEAGNEIVLTELNMDDDTQKWYVRWSEKDTSEEDVIVYHEGDLVENITGIYNISSALDGETSMDISRDTNFHPEPTVVVFHSDWLTTSDTSFQFEFVPTGSESRYKIFPVDQEDGKHQCLEYNPETLEIVMRDESDNENQLFRIVYVQSNVYLIQAYDESVLGFDLDDNGEAIGASVLARPYGTVDDSRLESWLLEKPHEDGEQAQ